MPDDLRDRPRPTRPSTGRALRVASAVLAAALAACGVGHSVDPDATPFNPPDVVRPRETGVGLDAAGPSDGGPTVDVSPLDGGIDAAANPPADGGAGSDGPVVANPDATASEASVTDASAADAVAAEVSTADAPRADAPGDAGPRDAAGFDLGAPGDARADAWGDGAVSDSGLVRDAAVTARCAQVAEEYARLVVDAQRCSRGSQCAFPLCETLCCTCQMLVNPAAIDMPRVTLLQGEWGRARCAEHIVCPTTRCDPPARGDCSALGRCVTIRRPGAV